MQRWTATSLFDRQKRHIAIAFLILTFTCGQAAAVRDSQGMTAENENETVQETRDYADQWNDTTILFTLVHPTGSDTLFVNYHPGRGTEQYSLIWKKDTLQKIFCYAEPENFIARIDTLDWHNLFLLLVDGGDGCPAPYRILQFKDNETYFLSDVFGNCEEISRIKYRYPMMSFYFDEFGKANEYPHRPKAKYVYNGQNHALYEKHKK